MKQLKLCSILLLLLFVSCSDQEYDDVIDSEVQEIYIPAVSGHSSDETDIANVHSKTKKNMESETWISEVTDAINYRLSIQDIDITIDNLEFYEGDNEIISAISRLNDNLFYVTYLKGHALSEIEFTLSTNRKNDVVYNSVNLLDGRNIGYFNVQGGEIIESGMNSNLVTKDNFFREWIHCMGAHLEFMSSGTVLGTISAIACIAFGSECAAYIVGTCAIKAAFWDWDTSVPYSQG